MSDNPRLLEYAGPDKSEEAAARRRSERQDDTFLFLFWGGIVAFLLLCFAGVVIQTGGPLSARF